MEEKTEYTWWASVVVVIILMVIVFTVLGSNNDIKSRSTQPEAMSSYTPPTKDTPPVAASTEPFSSWKCVDATSYNQNAYDDNQCSNGSETKYVSDSQAKSLDPNYSPGKAGASYYNNQ